MLVPFQRQSSDSVLMRRKHLNILSWTADGWRVGRGEMWVAYEFRVSRARIEMKLCPTLKSNSHFHYSTIQRLCEMKKKTAFPANDAKATRNQ